ncbi:hypothetical protein FOXG_02742 [Fusarium oxysporum f. sp. lycopersici 4287]|uniref:2-haloacid dehalogenase n=2 Tax=Fusarium oxysporum TaxID=5507 RepID=A0A0J9WIE2_FUSO4|nr:hypothetical protein FOXG_02742 [Fusarium oxysporum f. sp. lycopersici 4287]KNA98376.1 hypothetical protein FOXG_02742 [Fusarium oxysporum f. sp. lycopersici 4287]
MAAFSKNVVFDVVGTLVSYKHLYEAIKKRLGHKLIPQGIQPTLLGICWLEMAEVSTSESKPWFAAAHLWDASGAQSVGFNTAYSTILEGEYLSEIYGELDVVAETLPVMADRIIVASKQ